MLSTSRKVVFNLSLIEPQGLGDSVSGGLVQPPRMIRDVTLCMASLNNITVYGYIIICHEFEEENQILFF